MPQWIRAPECCLPILSLHFSLHSSASFMQYVRFIGKAAVQESQAREVQPSATASDSKLYIHSLHIKKKKNPQLFLSKYRTSYYSSKLPESSSISLPAV